MGEVVRIVILIVHYDIMMDESVEIMYSILRTSNAMMVIPTTTTAVATQDVILKHRLVRSMHPLARSTRVRPTPTRSPSIPDGLDSLR